VVPAERFALRYGVFKPLLLAMGLGPGLSHVDLTDERVRIRMGWAFSADLPRSAIGSSGASDGPVGGIGVHGWRGAWLVNGAASGLVTIGFVPTQRARVIGLPVALHTLRLSLEEPEAFLAALSGSGR
jgi:hypothetical protein